MQVIDCPVAASHRVTHEIGRKDTPGSQRIIVDVPPLLVILAICNGTYGIFHVRATIFAVIHQIPDNSLMGIQTLQRIRLIHTTVIEIRQSLVVNLIPYPIFGYQHNKTTVFLVYAVKPAKQYVSNIHHRIGIDDVTIHDTALYTGIFIQLQFLITFEERTNTDISRQSGQSLIYII